MIHPHHHQQQPRHDHHPTPPTTANHYASQHHDNNNNNRRRDVILVQHPLPPPSHAPTIDPTHHPPYLHVVRPGQHSMLVLNDGSHQRPPGWRLRGHCELCLTVRRKGGLYYPFLPMDVFAALPGMARAAPRRRSTKLL